MRTLFIALALSLATVSTSFAQSPTKYRLCTGKEEGNYFKAGQVMKKMSTDVDIDVIPTQGSLENLERVVKGECEGAFVQSDSLLVYGSRNAAAISTIERSGVLYKEDVQLFCNRKVGINDISDLNEKITLSVGPQGTGTNTTWDAFVLADKSRYGGVVLDTRSGQRVLAAVEDGSETQCFLWVAGKNTSFVKDATSAHGDLIQIVPTSDSSVLDKAKDYRGRQVYSEDTIAGDTYPRLAQTGFFGGYRDTPVLAVLIPARSRSSMSRSMPAS